MKSNVMIHLLNSFVYCKSRKIYPTPAIESQKLKETSREGKSAASIVKIVVRNVKLRSSIPNKSTIQPTNTIAYERTKEGGKSTNHK